MFMQHTPGPWNHELVGDSWWFDIFSASGKAVVCGDGVEGEANARLIAAAPELYEALKALVADIREYERVNNLAPNPGKADCWQSVTTAKAVLAKIAV